MISDAIRELRKCLEYERDKVADMMAQRDAARALADELAEQAEWPTKWPCHREDDDDCQAHGAEWPIGNEVCEWVLLTRAALAKWEASRAETR